MATSKIFLLLSFFLISTPIILSMSKEGINKEEMKAWVMSLSQIASSDDPFVTQNAIETIKKFINQGMPLNSDSYVLNPLLNTIKGRHYELASFLLDHGASPTLILHPFNVSLLEYFENIQRNNPFSPHIQEKIDFLEHAIKEYEKKHKNN